MHVFTFCLNVTWGLRGEGSKVQLGWGTLNKVVHMDFLCGRGMDHFLSRPRF